MSVAVTKIDLVDRFFNDSGALLAGGKVYTYITSTSTPLATYTDNTGATAHDNPIILDSSGNTQIWFAEGSSYKIQFKDSNGVSVGEDINGLVIPSTSGGTTTYVDIAFEVLDSSPPSASQPIGAYVATETIAFAINFAGSHGHVLAAGTNPIGSFTAIIKQNGTQIGTMVIATNGAFSFTTAGGTVQGLSTGDILEIIGPSSADASLVMFAWTLRGTA